MSGCLLDESIGPLHVVDRHLSLAVWARRGHDQHVETPLGEVIHAVLQEANSLLRNNSVFMTVSADRDADHVADGGEDGVVASGVSR